MSGALIIGLIVVVWLFVLAPLVLRGYRPIRRTNDAFEETRVVVAGGETPVTTPRKRPRFSAADIRQRTESEAGEFHTAADDLAEGKVDTPVVGVIKAEEQLIDAEPGFVSEKIHEVLAAAQEKVAETQELQHSDVVDENVLFMEDIDSPPITGSFAVPVPVVDESDPYPYDDAYFSPADLLDPDADYEFADEVAESELDPVFQDSPVLEDEADADLTEEDLEFAARRRGRGGYDPEADAVVAMTRYQRRQRTLAILGGVGLISLVVGFVFGGWFWLGTAVVGTLTVAYLYALRRQVRAENELRAQRIRHMRRARLGVRNAVDEKLGIPQRLRRPGAIVIELDDDSPDFVSLDTMYAQFARDEQEVWEDEYVDSRQAG